MGGLFLVVLRYDIGRSGSGGQVGRTCGGGMNSSRLSLRGGGRPELARRKLFVHGDRGAYPTADVARHCGLGSRRLGDVLEDDHGGVLELKKRERLRLLTEETERKGGRGLKGRYIMH